MYAFLLYLTLLLDSSPTENIVIEDSSDFVEINHIYEIDDKKQIRKRMTQIIWWEWKYPVLLPEKNNIGEETGSWYRSGSFIVRDYRVTWANHSDRRQITPYRQGKYWISLFYDDQDKCFRRVISKWIITTHSMQDREIENRKILQQSLRNRLTKPDTHGRMIRITSEIEELIDANPQP
tara:strand:- start:2750 stop:3286 length:537 start_codon:yes stop_codon:yes gene_type:complete